MRYEYYDGDELIFLNPSTNEVVATFLKPSDNKKQTIQRKSYKNATPFCDFCAVADASVSDFDRSIPVMFDNQKQKRYFLPDQLHINLHSHNQNLIQIDEVNMKLTIDGSLVLDIATLWSDQEFEIWVPLDHSIFDFQKLIENKMGQKTVNMIEPALDAFESNP